MEANTKADGVESSEDFLANLGRSLQEQDGVDVSLARIIATHVLVASPAADVVAKAKAAIIKLAADRASSSQAETDDA